MTDDIAVFCRTDQHEDCSGCACDCHLPPEPQVPVNHEDE